MRRAETTVGAPHHTTRAVHRQTAEPHGRHRRSVGFGRQLTLLTACALVVPAQLYLALPLTPRLQEAFRASPAAASWATSAFAFSYALCFLVFGPLCSRFGLRRLLVAGLLGLALSTAFASVAPSLSVLLALRAAQGAAAATLAPVALVWVTQKAPEPRRGTSLAIVTTGLLGAGLAGQLYGTGMLAYTSWRWMLLASAPAYVVLAVLVLAWLEPERSRPKTTLWEVYYPALTLVRRRQVVGVFLVATVVFGSFVGTYGALNGQLTRSGFSSMDLLAVEAIGSIGLLLAPTMRWWRPHGMEPHSQAILGFMIAALGVTAAQVTLGWVVPVAGTVVYVAGISLVVPGLVALLTRHAPAERAAAIGINTFLLFVGAAVAPLLLGHLDYRAALAVITAGLCTAAGVLAVAVAQRGGAKPAGNPPTARRVTTPLPARAGVRGR